MKVTISMEQSERREIIRRISHASALSWLVFQLFMLELFGPHISVMRAVTISTSVGVSVGLFLSLVQWHSLRCYVRDAGWWIPATTVGMTLGAGIGGAATYYAISGSDNFISTWQAGGLLSGALTGLMIAWPQWLVVRNWTNRYHDWFIPVVLGFALSSSLAWVAQLAITYAIVTVFGGGTWAVAMVFGIVGGALSGAGVYAYFVVRALNKVLPARDQVPNITID